MTALFSVDLPLGVSSVLHYITTTHFSLIFSHSWLQRNSSHICGSLGLSSLCINIMSPPPTHFSLTHARTSFFISVTALTSVDLLVLQKNDYDKFLKDIRSSERREIYVCLVSTSTSSLLKHPLNTCQHTLPPALLSLTLYTHLTPPSTKIYVCLVSASSLLKHPLNAVCYSTLPTPVNTHYIHTPSITEIYVCLVSVPCR